MTVGALTAGVGAEMYLRQQQTLASGRAVTLKPYDLGEDVTRFARTSKLKHSTMLSLRITITDLHRLEAEAAAQDLPLLLYVRRLLRCEGR